MRRLWINEFIGPTGRIDVRRLVNYILNPESSTTLLLANNLDWMSYMPEILALVKKLTLPSNNRYVQFKEAGILGEAVESTQSLLLQTGSKMDQKS